MAKSIKKFLKSFTLIELIIVIAIIAVLGATAFLLLSQWMSKGRDSQRISDLATIKTALDIAISKNDQLPLPDESNSLLYSGTEILYQGKFGDQVVKSIGTLNKLPKDKIHGNYDYSLLEDKITYRIRAEIENEQYKISLIKNAFGSNGFYRYIGKDIKALIVDDMFIYLPSMFATGYSEDKLLDLKDGAFIFQGDNKGAILTGLILEKNDDQLIIDSLTGLGISINDAYLIISQGKKTIGNTKIQDGGNNTNYCANLEVEIGENLYLIENLEEGVTKDFNSNINEIDNGIQYYKQSFSCLNQEINPNGEQSSVIIECDSGYEINGQSCTAKNCSAENININGHLYSIPNLNNGIVGEYIFTGSSLSNGNTYFKQLFKCDLGTIKTIGEEESYNVCNSGYIEVNNSCVLNICNGTLPANTIVNGVQNATKSWAFNNTPGDCTFVCKSGLTFVGGACIDPTYWTGSSTNGFSFIDNGVTKYPKSCNDLLTSTNPNFKYGNKSAWDGTKFADGIYWLKPTSAAAAKYTCDMTTNGGGRTKMAALTNLSSFSSFTQVRGLNTEQNNRYKTLYSGGQSAYINYLYDSGEILDEGTKASRTYTKEINFSTLTTFCKNNSIEPRVRARIRFRTYSGDTDTANYIFNAYNAAGTSLKSFTLGHKDRPSSRTDHNYYTTDSTLPKINLNGLSKLSTKVECKRVSGSICSTYFRVYYYINYDLPKVDFFIR